MITDEGSKPEMRILAMLLNQTDFNMVYPSKQKYLFCILYKKIPFSPSFFASNIS